MGIEFVELVNSVGFPVAVCVALFWNNRETEKRFERVLLDFKKSIDSNTETLNQYLRNSKDV